MSTLKELNADLSEAAIVALEQTGEILVFVGLDTMPKELTETLSCHCDVTPMENGYYFAANDPESLFALFSDYVDQLFGKFKRKFRSPNPVVYVISTPSGEQEVNSLHIHAAFISPNRKPELYHVILGAENEINELCVRLRWGKDPDEISVSRVERLKPGRNISPETFRRVIDVVEPIFSFLRDSSETER